MEDRGKYFLIVSVTVLIVCCFDKVITETTLSPNTTEENLPESTITSAIQTTAVPVTNLSSVVTTITSPSTENGTCESLSYIYDIGDYYIYRNWYIPYNYGSSRWYNMSFWGGYLKIPWKENLNNTCLDSRVYNYFLALTETHKDIAEIGEDIMAFDACIHNQTGNCVWNVTVEMRKCDGYFLYRFPWFYNQEHYPFHYNTYICFDKDYTDKNGTCATLNNSYTVPDYSYYNWYIPNNYGPRRWYNMSFWGGYLQIPWKENPVNACSYSFGYYFLALIEKHRDTADIGEDIITVDACIHNQTEGCTWSVTVEMRKCDGDLLYRFPWNYNQDYTYSGVYICFDREYADNCESSANIYSAGNVVGNLLNTTNEIQLGWFDAYRDGKQYFIPSLDDVDEIFDKCFHGSHFYHEKYFLKEAMPQEIGNVPVKLALCYVYKYYYGNYEYYDDSDDGYYYDEVCSRYVYARECHGKIQFDLSVFYNYWSFSFCFIHYNNIKVQPEIGHNHATGTDGTVVYNPYLQFRCSFEMIGETEYRVNWYINETLKMETGPSSVPDDLVFKGDSLDSRRLGYQVKCGVMAMGTSEYNESFSDNFFAGWKISDTSVKLSKNGHAIIEVEQTVPLGCAHTETGENNCEEILSIEDPNQNDESACKAGIRVQNDEDKHLAHHTIKSLKMGEKWDESRKYKFRLTTTDHDYDDKLYFEMELLVTKTSGHTPRVDTGSKVEVTNARLHWNKRCYSHADPHIRTADGRYFGQQTVGDHMLYRNKKYQSEVHEYARYCSQGSTSGPVCSCGVAVRSGADVFMINRCGNFTLLDFLQCGDGGILDVERIHDYRYKVTTPIGTIVIINLHRWGRTMDIDVYLSAKDYNNTDGLCGFFDGDYRNDFRHRNGSETAISNDYYGYQEFTNSWRLLDEENFLKNEDRVLDQWDENNGGTAGHPCSRPDSITRTKCLYGRRKRREDTVRFGREISKQSYTQYDDRKREKRSSGLSLTEEEAIIICNSSIHDAPAVREFSDKLADEDQNIVLNQCVFDIVNGNDTVWAEAHVDALNNIAATVIGLTPVFASNNSESVKSFLSQTCMNNCNGRGSCSDTGLCSCEGMFRGPDCGIDLRTPPVIYDIQGGGICDTAGGDECNCFVIRTDNIFEGFSYEISTVEVHFDGSRNDIGQSVHLGEYEDIFTGVCCAPEERKRRSVDDTSPADESDPSIIMFDFVISNDGSHFGESKSVYVFDSTCINFVSADGIVNIDLKGKYCYIGGVCLEQKSTLQTAAGCFVCDPESALYGWTQVECVGYNVGNTGLTTTTLIAIIAGSVSVGIILTLVIVYVRCFKGSKKRRTVEDIQSSQTYLSPGPSREKWGNKR